MKIEKINPKEVNFNAKVSPQFESFMRDFLSQGGNRIKNNYLLNNKIADLSKYGYNEYTINLKTNYVSWGREYSLVVTKDGQSIDEGTCIVKKNLAKNIVFYFLYMKKQLFKKLMKRNHIQE